MDKERIRNLKDMNEAWAYIQELQSEGSCFSLIDDDNGKYGLGYDGAQNIRVEDTQPLKSTFWIEADMFHKDPLEAIKYGLLKYYDK